MISTADIEVDVPPSVTFWELADRYLCSYEMITSFTFQCCHLLQQYIHLQKGKKWMMDGRQQETNTLFFSPRN